MRILYSINKYFGEGRALAVLAAAGVLVAFYPARAAASELVIHDDFNGQALGAAPAGWSTPHKWRVGTEGGITLLTMEDAGSWNGQAHDRRITKVLPAALARSWVLELDYAWRWGGDPASKRGFFDLRLDVLMVNAAGNGYGLRIPQGSLGLSGANPTERLFRIHLVTAGQMASLPLAEGRGHDAAGWRSLGLSAPNLQGVRLSWDRKSRRLTAARRQNGVWETVVEVRDASHADFDRLVVNPSNFNSSVAPQIDNVRLSLPRELVWGVGGHADNGAAFPVYRTIGAAAAIQSVKELDLESYRVDTVEVEDAPTGNTFFDSVKNAAKAQGVSVLPVLWSTKQNTTNASIEQLYALNFAKAENFGRFYRGQFTHVEILNEIDNLAIVGGDGSLISHYDSAKLARYAAVFRGLCDGLRAGDPAVKRLVGTAGWYHYGFIDYLRGQGVKFEALAWHWYSEMGSLQRVMRRLSSYGMPIWITEFNRRYGTHLGLQLSEGFSLHAPGAAPGSWTPAGAWRVDRHGINQVVTNTDTSDGGTGRALSRSLDAPVDLSRDWELEFYVGWQRGGIAGSGGHGDFSVFSEVDLVDAAGAGFRLRVRQGDSGNAANTGRIMQLYRIDPAQAQPEVLVAEGSGPDEAGWLTRGLSTPSLTRVRLKWAYNWDVAVQARRLSLRFGEGDGSTVFNIPVTQSWPTVDRLLLRAKGSVASGAGAQFDGIQFYRDDAVATEAEQARTLTAMAAEMSHFPQVEALFVYELFDQSNQQTSERNYGLYKVRRNAQFVYFSDGPRLGALELANYIAARGVTSAEPGSVLVDDSFPAPASFALGAWVEADAAGSWSVGHMEAQDNAATTFVRYVPYVTVGAAHEVSVHFPPGEADVPGVPIRVNASGGIVSTPVLQPARGGWVRVGEFNLRSGESTTASNAAYVEIGAGASGATLADAVRVQRKNVSPWSDEVLSNLTEPDIDGVSRMLKAAAGMPLGTPLSSPLVSLSAGGDALQLSFNRGLASPFYYFVEASEDLASWEPVAFLEGEGAVWFMFTGATVSESGSGESRRVTIEEGGTGEPVARRFFRLEVGQ